MATGYYIGPPGIATPTIAYHRALFLQRSETFLAQGRIIDGTLARDPGNTPNVGSLRAGLLMGRITATFKWANSVIGVTTAVTAAGASTLTVAAATVTEINRRNTLTGTATLTLTGPPVANHTVQSETITVTSATGTTVTLTGTTANAYVSGSFIGPSDGSQVPASFIPDWDYPLLVVDANGNSVSSVDFPQLPVSGIINSQQILPVWPTDTGLQNWIVSNINDLSAGQFVFDQRYSQS